MSWEHLGKCKQTPGQRCWGVQISRLGEGPPQQGQIRRPEGSARRPRHAETTGHCSPAAPSIAPPASWGKELGLASISRGGAPPDDVGVGGLGCKPQDEIGPRDGSPGRSLCAGLEVQKVEGGSCSESRAVHTQGHGGVGVGY